MENGSSGCFSSEVAVNGVVGVPLLLAFFVFWEALVESTRTLVDPGAVEELLLCGGGHHHGLPGISGAARRRRRSFLIAGWDASSSSAST